MKIYIAAPLFSESDRIYNEQLAIKLENLGFEIYLPQRNTSINDKSKSANSVKIYEGDTAELLSSDILIALLDGSTIDEGVATEIGFIAGFNELLNQSDLDQNFKFKLIYGLFTDSRDCSKTYSPAKMEDSKSDVAESQFIYRNLYTIGCCKKYGDVYGSVSELIEAIKEIIEEKETDPNVIL